jgi:hypothetical protein
VSKRIRAAWWRPPAAGLTPGGPAVSTPASTRLRLGLHPGWTGLKPQAGAQAGSSFLACPG